MLSVEMVECCSIYIACFGPLSNIKAKYSNPKILILGPNNAY